MPRDWMAKPGTFNVLVSDLVLLDMSRSRVVYPVLRNISALHVHAYTCARTSALRVMHIYLGHRDIGTFGEEA
jgi:hypothetical protein